MGIIKNYKLIIFLLLPFFLGWLINNSFFILNIYVNVIWIFSIGFIMFWFWVGKQFGQLKFNMLFKFLLGNIIWAISFGLFIWQFKFVDDLSRNMLLAGISQYYGLFTVTFATKIVMFYEEVIDSSQVMITSYIFMFVIFIIGFIYGSIRLNRSKRNNISYVNNEYSN